MSLDLQTRIDEMNTEIIVSTGGGLSDRVTAALRAVPRHALLSAPSRCGR